MMIKWARVQSAINLGLFLVDWKSINAAAAPLPLGCYQTIYRFTLSLLFSEPPTTNQPIHANPWSADKNRREGDS